MFGDQATYDLLKDVDLVEKHTVLVFIHVTLAKHFDGTLSARLSVHAHSDFTKGT